MCQHAELRTKIEELFLLGMPRKVCSRVEIAFKKRHITKSVEYNVQNAKIVQADISTECLKHARPMNNSTWKSYITYTNFPRTQAMFDKITHQLCKLKRSAVLKILMQTSQPAHVIATAILLFVMTAIWPNIFLPEYDEVHRTTNERSGLALITYLGAFATHFGAQIWMTFVSGLSLYFALPRHTFGLCQQILFPKYFAMNSMLSICTLIMYVKVIGGRWELSSYVQVIALSLCAAIEVAVRLYLAPPLLRLMREKHRFETSIGSGQEVGYLDQKDLLKCPHYQSIHRSFRQIHMIVAMGNLVTLVCTFLHLHYLASKIRVS